ncbi:MAG TPA: 5-oxoprolinase, partial [Thermopetrobacter sp.]|nr:5-oxoprolinase [Thermopetrobacter sp.]
ALIVDPNATIVVEPGWAAEVNAFGHLLLHRVAARERREAVGTRADPVMLEVFNNLFMSIAEQMGEALRQTASSVNIKERLDFSCAVFDAAGALVANAPHLPVHLGSMDRAVQAVIARFPAMRPGDAYVLNDPYAGGTHLPDITVVTPVFLEGEADPAFFVAARGHHADIGGRTPGSMSPDATTIDEEGVVIEAMKLVEEGVFLETQMRAVLSRGAFPARDPDANIADLKAQAAACARGAAELSRMVDHFGRAVVAAFMGHVQANAEENVRRVIDALKDGEFAYEMDNGAAIKVAVRVDAEARRAVVDFTGTSAQLPDNFNAPEAVTRAAVLYVFRCMVADAIPLNAGCLKPIDIIVPQGSMLNPDPPAAVVAGNVETSQAVVDALFGAMGVLAAAQGTMNNFTFGDGELQYYETICGGAGAGRGFHGADAVHTHMTNTRLTDVEVLELRYPVRLERFAIRRGSGGTGRWHGGDGVERVLVFDAPMRVSILSNRRRICPFGLAGGGPGACGENVLRRADGTEKRLASCVTLDVAAGDAIIIRTPGGGGYGE